MKMNSGHGDDQDDVLFIASAVDIHTFLYTTLVSSIS